MVALFGESVQRVAVWIRPRSWVLLDFLLAAAGLIVTNVRVYHADAGWAYAPFWLSTTVAVAPVLLAVRRMVPTAASVGLGSGALLSLLVGETDWVLLAGSALALWSVAVRCRIGAAIGTVVVVVALLPFLFAEQALSLAWRVYPDVYQQTVGSDGTITTRSGIPVETLDGITAMRWNWWFSAILALAWMLGLGFRWWRGRHAGERWWRGGEQRTPGDRIDGLRDFLARRESALGVDALIAVAMCSLLLISIRRGQIGQISPLWWSAPDWLINFVAYSPLGVFLRRMRPVIPAVLMAFASYLAYWQVEDDNWTLLAVFALALYWLAVQRSLRVVLPVMVATLGLLPLASGLTGEWLLLRLFPSLRTEVGPQWIEFFGNDQSPEYDRFIARQWPLSLSLLLALPAFVGVLVRFYRRTTETSERAEELQKRTEQLDQAQVVLTERARIARDLHDVIAHHANLIVIQAETGPDLVQKGNEDVLQGFRRIGDAGRRALGELDRMLSALRAPDGLADPELAPQPGLSDLHRLTSDVGGQGTAVELHIRGDVEAVPSGHQLTAYRIVQEALTNVVRHAEATEARVAVEVKSDGLAVEVTDDGQGFRTEQAGRGGRHGLAGMRERARVHSGTLTVSSTPGAGTVISAWLPIT